jgi:hypothetical protein
VGVDVPDMIRGDAGLACGLAPTTGDLPANGEPPGNNTAMTLAQDDDDDDDDDGDDV